MESAAQKKYNSLSLHSQELDDLLDDLPYCALSDRDLAALESVDTALCEALTALRPIIPTPK